MHITAFGEKIHQRSSALLDELEEAKQEASLCATTLSGTLKTATALNFGVAHLSPAISTFMHQHPKTKIDLDMSDRHIDLVKEGVDLVIRIGTLEDSPPMARKLASVRHIVCASPDFFNRYGRPKTPQDLTELPTLCYGNLDKPDIWQYCDKSNVQAKVKVPLRMRATNSDALVDAAVAGLGLLCKPSFIVHSALERGELIPNLTNDKWYAMNVYGV